MTPEEIGGKSNVYIDVKLFIEYMLHGLWYRVGCLSEWLRSCTRNAMGHSRVGSNPAAVETIILQLIFTFDISHPKYIH